ncbi:hypothetical protein TNCV_5060581 [Trichonephila clavipes]|nr:hypothetical protein TNCV_5060581 [Trichonephila clavipes]
MYVHANDNARAHHECITRSFLIDECRITEFVSGYNVNFVEKVRFTSLDMMLVYEELYAVKAWKKES